MMNAARAIFGLLTLVYFSTSARAQYLVVYGRDGKNLVSGYEQLDGSVQANLDLLAAQTGARPGKFPALVDMSSGRWIAITATVDSAVEKLEEEISSSVEAAKSDKLKGYENKVIEYLRSEAVIKSNAVSVTLEQLNAMYDTWDTLPDDKGDAKASKYERKLRPVIRNGGSETGVRYHHILTDEITNADQDKPK